MIEPSRVWGKAAARKRIHGQDQPPSIGDLKQSVLWWFGPNKYQVILCFLCLESLNTWSLNKQRVVTTWTCRCELSGYLWTIYMYKYPNRFPWRCISAIMAIFSIAKIPEGLKMGRTSLHLA
jgi:hypothetical protein